MTGLIAPDPATTASELLDRAVGWRCGTALSVDPVPATPADPAIAQQSASYGPADQRTPAGGAALDPVAARAAAIGELLERYAAATDRLPTTDSADVPTGDRILRHHHFSLHSDDQQRHPDFPYTDSYARTAMTRAWSLADNVPAWVPANLVGNDPRLGHLATSNGLAAGPTTGSALLRASQELIERDALMITWLHQVGGRRMPLPALAAELAAPIGAELTAFDITPDYSPHPVVLIAGTAALAGRPRHSIGLACRADRDEAATKAVLEWAQGVSFAGVNTAADPASAAGTTPEQATDFDQHAIFYTRRPELWPRLPIWRDPGQPPPNRGVPTAGSDHRGQLFELVGKLDDHGIDLYYRDLTSVDLAGCGVRAVRVLSPQLVPIHSDHRWPHLGGTATDLHRRYPWADDGGFPSDHPHPLG